MKVFVAGASGAIGTPLVRQLLAAGHQVTVPGNSVDHALAYECKGVTQGAYVGNNTVTFDYSADSHEYPDADDTDSDTQAVTVTGDPDPTNATVTISGVISSE